MVSVGKQLCIHRLGSRRMLIAGRMDLQESVGSEEWGNHRERDWACTTDGKPGTVPQEAIGVPEEPVGASLVESPQMC